jgi:hypothetical protein
VVEEKRSVSSIRKDIKDLVGLDISNKQFNVFLKEYNNFEMPISKRMETLNIQKFIDYIFERTDIPITGSNI